MRTLFLFALLTLAVPSASAQFGIGATFGADTNLGAQASYYKTVQLADNLPELGLGGDVTLYLPDSESFGGVEFTATYFEFNANAHYVVLPSEAFNAYVLGGLNYSYVTVSASDDDGFAGALVSGGDEGINLGGGADLPLGPGRGFAELKFTLGGFDQLSLTGGIRF